jgi:DNA-binding Xre family transcriptional regulator
MRAQFIRTPKGEELAVLAKSDFERLKAAAEDRADDRAAERARAELARGDDELVPFEIAERLLDRENPIRVWREHRGLTVAALADKAGIAASYLSLLERGKRGGKVSTLRALAKALDVTLDDLAAYD